MVTGISSDSMNLASLYSSVLNSSETVKAPEFSGSDMFDKLSDELGLEDGESITKDKLQEYIDSIESDDSADKGKLGFLNQLMDNYDSISGEDGEISSEDMQNNVELLKPPSLPKQKPVDSASLISDAEQSLLDSILDSDEEDDNPLSSSVDFYV